MRFVLTLLGLLIPVISAFSQTLVITQGGTYSGTYTSTDPSVPAISVQTSASVTIQNSTITSAGNGVDSSLVANSNITVTECYFYGTLPNVYGMRRGQGVHIVTPQSVDIAKNYFHGWLKPVEVQGGGKYGASVNIDQNKIEDCDGRPSNGNGGYLLDDPNGTAGAIAIQDLYNVAGGISWNYASNSRDRTYGDMVSVYDCTGTSESNPFYVYQNLIDMSGESVYNVQSTSGAITTDGDPGAGLVCHYIDIISNTVIHTTNGPGLAYGTHNYCDKNIVVGTNMTDDGQTFVTFDVGIGGYRASDSDHFDNNSVGLGSGPQTYPIYTGGGGTFSNNTLLYQGQTVTLSDEGYWRNQWIEQAANSGIQIGP
jgi:hypothetical protein